MKKFLILYSFIVLLDLVFIDLFPLGRLVVKPLIVGSLLTHYIINVPKQHSFIILGLVFAMLGDVILLFDGSNYFKLGLGAFLIMQLCYIKYLKPFATKSPNKTQLFFMLMLLLTLLIFCGYMLLSEANEKYLVVIYALVLSLMGYFAILFPRKNKKISFVGVGALLFIFSDLVLGVNRFVHSIMFSEYLIMVLYCAGQYLIIHEIAMDAKAYWARKALKES